MFWQYGEELPAGVGGERWCAAHLAYLAVFLTLSVCYALFYKQLDGARRKSADRVLGSLVFFFGLCHYGILALTGHFGLYTLPLHLCTLMFLAALLHAWTCAARPGSLAARFHSFLGALLFFPGIPGTWAALLFPDWLDYPFRNALSISCFLSHGLLAVYGASILVRQAEAPDPNGLFWRDLKNSALFLGAGSALMYVFDRAAGVNYWFLLAPSVDSPFEGVWRRGGPGGYLSALLLTAAAVTALWYGLRYLLFVRGRERRSGRSAQ